MARTKLVQRPSRPERQDTKGRRHSPTKWSPEDQGFMLARWAESHNPRPEQREKYAHDLAAQCCAKDSRLDYDERFSYYKRRVRNWFKNKKQTDKRVLVQDGSNARGRDTQQDSVNDTNPTSQTTCTPPSNSFRYATPSTFRFGSQSVASRHLYATYRKAGGCLDCHEATECPDCLSCTACLQVRQCQECTDFCEDKDFGDKTCDGDCGEEVTNRFAEASALMLLANCAESYPQGYSG